MDDKLNRQRWLTAGLQALAESGPDGLRIMPIAEQLGVTKGSFYWHFKNLEEYQTNLLQEWERYYTREAIACLEKDSSPPGEKLRIWFTAAAYADLRLDRAIRLWSLNNAAVREVQASADEERIKFLSKLLRGVGWPKDDATTLGQWAYCAWVGYAMLGGPTSSEKQIKLILSLLSRPSGE